MHGAFNEARQYLGKEDFEVTRSGATVRVRGKPDDPMSLIAGLAESVEVPLDGNAELLSRTDTFVNTFRGCAPYIKMHSGKVMVIHMASVLLDKPQIFDEMMEDIASMSVLGVRIVLVVGIRDQVDARLDAMNVEVKYAGLDRVSDPETLRVVQEVSGYARSRVEGSFARGVKGLARVMSGGVGIDVVGTSRRFGKGEKGGVFAVHFVHLEKKKRPGRRRPDCRHLPSLVLGFRSRRPGSNFDCGAGCWVTGDRCTDCR